MLSSRLAACVAALTFALPAAARAADPVMPLSQVHSDMHCVGYSVIRGVDISAFDVDVIDVVVDSGQSSILVRAHGPAVDDTGIAEGFSGSPVYCPDGNGGTAVIGAIAQGTGDYGNKLVFLTPIETMLGEAVDPPASARAMPRALKASRRPLATPLSFGGVSGPVATALRRAGKRTGRALYAAPASPRAEFPVQQLRPGASVSMGLSSGDLSAGAVGTVTYVDGDKIWAFGHPLDAVGRRALLLQDAWVHTVVGNPIDAPDLTSYKLASPGHDLGTFTNDAPSAVVGRTGALPPRFPLRVTATDEDTGQILQRRVTVVDENAAGLPAGVSPLSLVAPIAVAQAVYDTLRGMPPQQSGRMCMRISVRERKQMMGFCNTYVGGGTSSIPMAGDVASAAAILDSYNFGVLHITGVDVDLTLRRDLRQAWITRVKAPRVLRPGTEAKITVVARRVRGAQLTRTFRLRVPRGAPRGARELVLTGTPADNAGFSDMIDALESIFDFSFGPAGDGRGPTSVAAVARGISALAREDGVSASFLRPGASRPGRNTPEYLAYRDAGLRLTGTVRTKVRVAAAAKRPRGAKK